MSFKIQKGNYTNTLNFANLSANQTVTIPNATGTIALTNQLAKVATSNNYNDLSNRPALKTVATSGAYNDLSGKPTLAKVATSGSYNDLTNKPNIPANQSGYITQTWRSGNNWYRKWSDGWIEQGGVATVVHGGTVTMQYAMSSASYGLIVLKHTESTANRGSYDCSAEISTSKTFIVKTKLINNLASAVSWYVFGV